MNLKFSKLLKKEQDMKLKKKVNIKKNLQPFNPQLKDVFKNLYRVKMV